MIKIGVLISGSGSNLQSIIEAVNNGSIVGEIALVISNDEEAYGLTRAKSYGIPTKVVKHGDYGQLEPSQVHDEPCLQRYLDRRRLRAGLLSFRARPRDQVDGCLEARLGR